MTKLFSAAVVLLTSSAAFAYPAIGDYAMMKGTASNGQQNANISLERSIMDFDATNDSFVVVETQEVDGQAQTTTSIDKRDDMITQEQVTQILTYCSMFGGVSESITVPAGTFPTCKLPTKDENDQQDGMVWVGDVSFGIVRAIGTQQGAEYHLELESFRAGN